METDVGGLSPGTSYSVVVYATNAAGSGLASREHRFETRKHDDTHTASSQINLVQVLHNALQCTIATIWNFEM